MLTSERYPMLDDRIGLSLVSWKPAIEQRLGQQLRPRCAAETWFGTLDDGVGYKSARRSHVVDEGL